MLSLRGLAPKTSFWRDAQFDTIRLCLVKVAARVTEMVARIKIALPTAYPYRIGFTMIAGHSPSCRRSRGGGCPQIETLRPNLKPRPARPRRHERPRPISAITVEPPAPDE